MVALNITIEHKTVDGLYIVSILLTRRELKYYCFRGDIKIIYNSVYCLFC